MTMPGPPYRFLFLWRLEEMWPIEGRKEPRGEAFVVRSVPGELLVWHRDLDEAIERLQESLRLHWEHGGGLDDWYDEALRRTARAHPERAELLLKTAARGPGRPWPGGDVRLAWDLLNDPDVPSDAPEGERGAAPRGGSV